MVVRDLIRFTGSLECIDGIWYTRKEAAISYPDDGHELCFRLEDNSFWFRHRNDCILEVLKQFPTSEFFFEIGGGNGFVAKYIENSGIETVLVEPGRQGALNAKKRGLKNIICASLETAGFKSGSLPAVGLFDVIEHIEDDKAFLTGLSHLMAPGGYVFITVPAFNYLWSQEDDEAGHYRRYTLKSLNHLLEETGFKVEYITYFFSVLPLPIFFSRTLPTKLGLLKKNKSVDQYENAHSQPKGIAGKLLAKVWSRERNRIGKGKTLPLGGSCLAVATTRTANGGNHHEH